MRTLKILILEDDLETLSIIFKVLSQLTEIVTFIPMVFAEYTYVEKYVNNSDLKFDLILLDRDCALGGSFHVLDIERFGPEKIISISSCPPYNMDAKKRGVTKIIEKDYTNLKQFEDELFSQLTAYLTAGV